MILETLTHAAVTAAPHVITGIIDVLNDQTNQLSVLVKNVAGVAIVIAFIFIAHKARWSTGAVLGGILACGLIFFALNGGLEWVGAQFEAQFGAAAFDTSVVDAAESASSARGL
jgi:hypothetical protein